MWGKLTIFVWQNYTSICNIYYLALLSFNEDFQIKFFTKITSLYYEKVVFDFILTFYSTLRVNPFNKILLIFQHIYKLNLNHKRKVKMQNGFKIRNQHSQIGMLF